MVDRDRHHPSIVIWSIANESWGYDLVGNAEHRSWLHDIYLQMKATVTGPAHRRQLSAEPELPYRDRHRVTISMGPRSGKCLERGFSLSRSVRRPVRLHLQRVHEHQPRSPNLRGVGVRRAGGSSGRTWKATSRGGSRRAQEWADGAAYVHALNNGSPRHLDKVFDSWAPVRRDPVLPGHVASDRGRCREAWVAGYVLTGAERRPWGGERFVRTWRADPQVHRPVGGAQPAARGRSRRSICIGDLGDGHHRVEPPSSMTASPEPWLGSIVGPRRDRPVQAHDRSAREGEHLALSPFTVSATCDGIPSLVNLEVLASQ